MGKPVIRIPSKNIYSIENNKVIDNNIDFIEAIVRKAVPDNHYNESVYNENVYEGFEIESEPISNKEAQPFATAVSTTNPVFYVYGSYVYADNQYYVSKVINIPIQYDNTHKVDALYLGLDKEGEKEIKYVCSGKIIKGTTNAFISITAKTNGIAVTEWSAIGVPPINNGYYKQEETTGSFSVPSEYSKTTISENGEIVVTAKIDIPTKDNLAETDVTAKLVTIDGKDYMQIDIKNLLCGIRLSEVGGRGTATPINGNKTSLGGYIRGGTYTEYIPEQVTITVYGNTIGISLKEEKISIGNGKNVYSFSGNELIQMTDK